MKIGLIFGTRPEIIKMAPVIRECEKRKLDYFIVHTNQHYSYEMDKIFFDELNLPHPKYNLNCGYDSFKKQISFMSKKTIEVLKKEKPDHFLVYADPTSCLAGALAAAKTNVKIHHIEAGLRSNDLKMLEEINRIITGQLADYHFTSLEQAKRNLIEEGTDESKIFVVGNTIVDSVYQNIELAKKNSTILKKLDLEGKEYFLLTFHRAENVDDEERLSKIIKSLELICNKYKLPIVYPMHPRTKKMLNQFNIKVPKEVTVIEPTSFLDFLQLESNSRLVITDSGGIQEEACILNVPCVTLRDNTERPETLEIGSNILSGVEPEKVLECVEVMYNNQRNWEQPYGDGKSAEKILDILEKNHSQ